MVHEANNRDPMDNTESDLPVNNDDVEEYVEEEDED